MDKQLADKLVIGTQVLAPRIGITKPLAIVEIIKEHDDPRTKGQLPLFMLEGSFDLTTYRLLVLPEIVCTGDAARGGV